MFTCLYVWDPNSEQTEREGGGGHRNWGGENKYTALRSAHILADDSGVAFNKLLILTVITCQFVLSTKQKRIGHIMVFSFSPS